MEKHLGRHLPAPARTALIHAYRAYTYTLAASMDAVESARGKRPPMIPPRRKIFTGSGDFLQTGQEFLRYFKDLGHLKPNHRVLDVGSGIGRMAIPLTSYLNHEGSYEGFDIVPMGVE